MTSGNVFIIRNLKVQHGNDIILHIPHLDIPRGKVIFILGNSGSGKTTFLETLALMNSFKNMSSQILFFPDQYSKRGIVYQTLYTDEMTKTEVRQKYFTFVFQDTLLLPELNLKQNVALTQVIQNKPIERAVEAAHIKLSEYNIEELELRSRGQVSGGQNQRIAFARAAIKEATVMFADEPTGNLGMTDSKIIMADIRKFVDESNDPKTAIIVTHNIKLALEYADQIVVIQKNHLVLPQNILHANRNSKDVVWEGLTKGNESDSLEDMLQVEDEYTGDQFAELEIDEQKVEMNRYSNKEFASFFSPLSRRDLSLKNAPNWILVGILAFAFCAIGFSSGSLNVLKEKMADPFVNWINIELSPRTQENLEDMRLFLHSDSAKIQYSVRSEFPYNRFGLNFEDDHGRSFTEFGRTIDDKDPIVEEIMKNENLVEGNKFQGFDDIGIIINKDFAKKYGITNRSLFVKMHLRVGLAPNILEYSIPIPLRAIVKNLPGESAFLVTNYFLSKLWYDDKYPFNPSYTHSIKYFFPGDQDKATIIRDSLLNYLNSIDSIKSMMPDVSVEKPSTNRSPNANGFEIKAYFFPPDILPWNNVLPIANGFLVHFKNVTKDSMELIHVYEYPTTVISNIISCNRISINISNLDRVSELRNILKRYGVEIEMSKVESLNNYRFVVRMTNFLSIAIILICIISVCIFMGYILFVHLYKNRGFIGLLKAFGVSQKALRNIYTRSFLISLGESIIVGCALSAILGYSYLLKWFISFGYKIDDQYSYFDLVNISPIIFIVLLMFTSYCSILFVSNSILWRSPGDLLYDRAISGSVLSNKHAFFKRVSLRHNRKNKTVS